MKKPIYLFSLLFMLGVSLMSCRDEARETDTLDDDINTTVTEPTTTTDDSFAQYDTNRDNQWDENEFSQSYQSEYSGYDRDASGDLNNEEFSGATFRSTDRNRDNTISRQEWDEGYNNTYGDYTNQDDFDRFDTDQSGDLSDTEWNQGFGQSNMFSTYDEDQNNSVSMQEWTRANFSRWDRNGDGYLDQQEFQEYNRAMMQNNNTGGNNMNQQGTQNNNTQNNQNTNNQNNTQGNTTQGNQ